MSSAYLDQQFDRLATLSPVELRAEWRRVYPAVTECIEKERAAETMLEASGGVARFVLQIKRDIRQGGQRHRDEVCVS